MHQKMNSILPLGAKGSHAPVPPPPQLGHWSNELSMVKNIYFYTKINLLWCQGAELHIEVALGPFCCHCCWHWCTSDSSESCSNQSSRVKNIYLYTKIILPRWSGPWPCCWYCCWCWWTSDGSETFSNEVSMVKNIYLGTKIILL